MQFAVGADLEKRSLHERDGHQKGARKAVGLPFDLAGGEWVVILQVAKRRLQLAVENQVPQFMRAGEAEATLVGQRLLADDDLALADERPAEHVLAKVRQILDSDE